MIEKATQIQIKDFMKKIGIGIIGLGNVGSRLYKEIVSKKKEINLKKEWGVFMIL